MTPPPEHFNESWHYLRHGGSLKMGQFVQDEKDGPVWIVMGFRATASWMAQTGWVYVAPWKCVEFR